VRLIRTGFLAVVLAVSGCAGNSALLNDIGKIAEQALGQPGSALSIEDITGGLKQALSIGTGNVVSQLGQVDGFNADPVAHIPLPTALVKARNVASKVGLASSFNSLEDRMNQAAEKAVPLAKDLFVGAIQQMTLDDARGILQGSDDAATQFFRRTTGNQLRNSMRPIIDNSLGQVGAVRASQQLMSSYHRIPFAPPVEANLTEHVLDKGMDGIWHYIAVEESAIRQNPVKRTTDLLRRVFGSQDL